jgi:hypothetical protein
MPKQIISIIIIAAYTLLYGCTSNNDNNNIFILDKNIKSNAQALQADTIGFFEDLIYAKYFFVYQDSILIVQNQKYEDVYFLEFYDLKQQQLLAKLYRLGNGPNELLSAVVSINGNILTVSDYVKNQVAFVNIDSVLKNPAYTSAPIRYYTDSPNVAIYNNNQLLIGNPNCFKDDKLGIDQKAPRFIVTDQGTPYIEEKEYQYYTRNVACGGLLITKYEKDRIFYANMHRTQIEIYNNDLNLLKLISGPDKLPAKYVVEDNEVSFKTYAPFSYLNFCTSLDYFYLTYMGDNLAREGSMYDYPLWIFQFDWDGNFVNSYYIGRYVSSISLSADGESFYATAMSEEEIPFLIKLSIK